MNCWRSGTLPPYIPTHTKQENSMVAKGDFVYHGDHLSVPRARCCIVDAFQQRTGDLSVRGADAGLSVLSHQGNLPPAAAKTTVLHLDDVPPGIPAGIPARQGAETVQLRTGVNVAGVKPSWKEIFASLDRLGWARSRLRGLWKVDGAGYMAALAHNVLKMVRRPGRGVGPPGSVAPADAIAASAGHTADDAVGRFSSRRCGALLG